MKKLVPDGCSARRLFQVFECQVSILLIDAQPFLHQAGTNLHARRGAGGGGYRHEAGSAVLANLGQQVGASISGARTQARHAVDL